FPARPTATHAGRKSLWTPWRRINAMTYNRDDPSTWLAMKPLIIGHDVARGPDRSTAVVGGFSAFNPRIFGIAHLEELPIGLSGSQRVSALAEVDRRYYSNGLIIADLSNDASYAEHLSN